MDYDTLKPNKLIAIYGRVSSTNQENEGTIETQIAAVKEYANAKGYIIVREYLDNGWSGDSIVRPELDKLRVDAKKKVWEAVLVYDPDRLARRYSYQELVMDELREAGAEVIFVTTPAPTNSVEKILYGVQGLFAEYERAKIAERFRLGKVRKANEGYVIASEAPYGYTFIKRKGNRGDTDFHQGYYQVNEKEAEIVGNIFSWVADDALTIRGVVKKLLDMGIKPRKSKREVWSTSTLSTLLRNKTYIGEAHFGASYAIVPIKPLKKEVYRKNKKTSRRAKPEEEWIKIKVPAIIDRNLFERTAKRLKSNYESLSRNTKNEYLLSGKIWCSCGVRRSGEGPQRGKHLYYRCTSRVKSFPLKSECLEAGMNVRIVDRVVWNKIFQLMSSPELLLKQAERWLSTQRPEIKESRIDVDSFNAEIVKLKEQQRKYTKAYSENVISLEQLKEYSFPVKEKITEIEKQSICHETQIDKKSENVLPDYSDLKTFAQEASIVLGNLNFQSKKAVIQNIINKVVGTKEELTVSGNIPIKYLDHVEFNPNYRYGVSGTQHEDLLNSIAFSFNIRLKEYDRKNIA